jgi:ketosteroid isomerase-like protein
VSGENVERLRSIYAEWAKGNFRAGGELFAPDVAFEQMSDGRTALGRNAIEGYMRDFLAQWSEFWVDAEGFVEVGNTVVVTERQHATGKSSGIETGAIFYATWTFRDGLVVRVRWETDREQALETAGLSGDDAHSNTA